MSDQIWWHLARAAGLVSWVALTGSTVAGLLLAARGVSGQRVRAVVGLHRSLATAGLALVAVHLAALVADDYVSFGLTDLLVPLHSTWRPGAVAWGVVAMWVLVIVEASTLLPDRLSRRTWHLIHRLSLPAWAAASIHMIRAGTDADTGRLFGAVALVIGVTGFAALARLLGLFRRPAVAGADPKPS